MLIIGDTHCNYNIIFNMIEKSQEKNIVLIGDHGFGEDYLSLPFSTSYLSQRYENKQFYIVQGNHDNSDFITSQYNITTIRTKGYQYIIPIEEYNVLFIPGALSYDKILQQMKNTWYEDEEMTYSEFYNLFDYLASIDRNTVDMIISHDTALSNYYNFFASTEKSLTNSSLEEIYSIFPDIPKIHGHLHINYYKYNTNTFGIGENNYLIYN